MCVFCGSRTGGRPSYAAAARRVGTGIAERGLRLVYGGGRVGLMGVVADAALAAGGEVVGVIPDSMDEREVSHTGLTELHVVGSLHERKVLMADLSDAFLALPGGYGTLEEFLEVLTWAQLGLHGKPCGLLDVDGFYEPLRQLFDGATREGFVSPEHRSLVLTETDPGALIELLQQPAHPGTGAHLSRES
ncbi:MAG: TIGR00730 family Rossman fold protein [Rubrobacter sp.]|nr:TIGR00730 family Rossman fold protein [Rubrobacter sp.]